MSDDNQYLIARGPAGRLRDGLRRAWGPVIALLAFLTPAVVLNGTGAHPAALSTTAVVASHDGLLRASRSRPDALLVDTPVTAPAPAEVVQPVVDVVAPTPVAPEQPSHNKYVRFVASAHPSVAPSVVVASAPAPTASTASSAGMPAGLICIHNHEGSYGEHSGNGFFGGYQYTPGTWNSSAKRAGVDKKYINGRADLAPPSIQDQVALHDWNYGPGQIHQNWPNTSRICHV